MFLRVLKDSRVLSCSEYPDPNKPAWTAKRTLKLFNNLPPEKLAEIKKFAQEEEQKATKNVTFDSENNNKLTSEKRRAMQESSRMNKLAKDELKAFLLTQPKYVTSFNHFVSKNAHRIASTSSSSSSSSSTNDTKQKKVASRELLLKMRKLYEAEKENFQMEQLSELAKRRVAAEAWAARAQQGLDEVKEAKTEKAKQEVIRLHSEKIEEAQKQSSANRSGGGGSLLEKKSLKKKQEKRK